MAFRQIINADVYYCLSGDTKPIVNIQDGSLAIETDTGFEWSFDLNSTAWFQRTGVANTVGGDVANQVLVPDGVAVTNTPDVTVSTGVDIAPKYIGARKAVNMSAQNDQTTLVGAENIFDDATGVKQFTVTIDPWTIPTGDNSIVIGYSTTDSDADVLVDIKAFSEEQVGSRAGTVVDNIIVLNENKPSVTITWDGTNTYKRIAGVTNDADVNEYTLTTVS